MAKGELEEWRDLLAHIEKAEKEFGLYYDHFVQAESGLVRGMLAVAHSDVRQRIEAIERKEAQGK
jgi:hypothetical protein